MNIRYYWKKLIYLLITGSTSVFIAACYGMPASFSQLKDWSIKVKDSDNNPIEGLEVKILRHNEAVVDTVDVQYTDSIGVSSHELYEYTSDANYMYEATIRDIDSSKNGGEFSDTTVILDDSEEIIVNLKNKS